MAGTVPQLDEYGVELSSIDRRRKLAEGLFQQGMENQLPQTLPGGITPRISPFQGLARVLQGYLGGKTMEDADERTKALSAKHSERLAAALGGMPMPTTQTTDNWQGDPSVPGDSVNKPQTTTTQPTMQQQAGWLGQLSGVGPDAVAIGNTLLGHQQKTYENEENRSARLLQTAMQLDARSQDRELSMAQRAEAQASAEALRRELASGQQQFQASQSQNQRQFMEEQQRRAAADRQALVTAQAGIAKIPPGFRATPDGNLQAIPGGPADLKTQKQAETVDSGRSTVSGLVTTLRDYYDQLHMSGGITDPKAGLSTNLAAGIASSGPGQAIGRLVGTQNQSARNAIAQQRPLLLNAIKQATGMSAKQMDSNAELKLYLSAATDPTLDIEANRAALEQLDKLYGLGGQAPKAEPPQRRASDRQRRSTDQSGVIDFNSLPSGDGR